MPFPNNGEYLTRMIDTRVLSSGPKCIEMGGNSFSTVTLSPTLSLESFAYI